MESNKYHVVSLTCEIYKQQNKWTNQMKQKQIHRYRGQTDGCQNGGGGGMGKKGEGD